MSAFYSQFGRGEVVQGTVQAVLPGVAIDTFPETPVTATWGFKLRIGNRNGYGNFSQEPFGQILISFSKDFQRIFKDFQGFWPFKGSFSSILKLQELWLSTGQLASEPLQLTAEVVASGAVRLTWQPPISDGYVPVVGYEAQTSSNSIEDIHVYKHIDII